MPATSPGGFPYVLPADHPLEYPAQSQQLATVLDAAWVDDPGTRRQMGISSPTVQSIPNNVSTKLTAWGGGAGDGGDGLLTYAAGVITVTAAGVFDISAWVRFAGNATGYRLLELMFNGGALGGQTVYPAGAAWISLHGVMSGAWLAAGTQLQVNAMQTSGVALDVNAARWNVRKVANA